jgi:signal transduction histidine kinase
MDVLLIPQNFQDLLKTLMNPANPIYVSLFIVTAFFGIIILIYKYLINPITSYYKKEKENIELKSAKLMALFAELDPDPMIRIDSKGTIIVTNNAAKKILSLEQLQGTKIFDVLPFLRINIKEAIRNNTTLVFTDKINGRFFSILFRAELNSNIAQIYFRDITDFKTNEEKLIESEKKLRELSDHLQDLIEEERQRIARGLHDGVGQTLSLLRMKILRMSEKELDEHRGSAYKSLVQSLEDAILEVKNISYILKPKLLEEMGLGVALKYLVNNFVTETGIEGEANIIGGEIRLDTKLEIYLYRVAQEAINNIMKYSKATSFSLQLLITNKLIRMIVSDNGVGFNVNEVLEGKMQTRGVGLTNIRERVESFRGILKIDSEPGSGTMLVVEIPLSKELTWQNQNQFVS